MTAEIPPPTVRSRLLLASALFVALLLRLHCLRAPYLWLDEFVTLWSVGAGMDGTYLEMLDRALRWTASGPLFVLAYRLSCDLAGNVDWGLKLPGVLCGVASVWAVWWAARKIFRRDDVAVASAWLVAVAPPFVNFSQEARPYMPAVLLSTIALGFLAAWLRSGRRIDLAATTILSLVAVGFHLLAALNLAAQFIIVVAHGAVNRWPTRRWLDWVAAQFAAGVGLWFVGIQFWLLSGRHGSMIFETHLPAMTRRALDQTLWSELLAASAVLLSGLAMARHSRRFPQTPVSVAWREHALPLVLALGSYVLPSMLLSLFSVLRVVDPWPRYYFLFHPGLMMGLAWIAVRPLPKRFGWGVAACLTVLMLSQYSWPGGELTARLNNGWADFDSARVELRRRLGPDDLVLSRSGLIESNQTIFLEDPVGRSYLKCFLEAGHGPLPGAHIPLPFSAETPATMSYMESVARDKLAGLDSFWLVNVGPLDVDYRRWIDRRFGSAFRKTEELQFASVVLCRYKRVSPLL